MTAIRSRAASIGAILAAFFLVLPAHAETRPGQRPPDVIYVPTPQLVVDEMLKIAAVKKGDVLYDLGSGDGRIPVTAAKRFGIRAVGIDIDPDRIKEARANAKKNGVEKLVSFRNEDLFKANFREATVVTLYLLPDLNVKLRPRLWKELKPGCPGSPSSGAARPTAGPSTASTRRKSRATRRKTSSA